MRLTNFHIDGFGIYHDQGARDLPAGLVLLVGDNESGKSTLMEFLRTMLFGFPPKMKKKYNDYEPLRGGNHGGRLQVSMADGRRFTISRSGRQPALLTAEDGGGSEQGEPALRLLAGLDRRTFEHVFALGLDELQGLAVLSEDGVQGRLFAAGAGLGGVSIPEIIKNLDKETDDLLLTGRAHRPEINRLLKQQKEIEARLSKLTSLSGEYAATFARREALQDIIDQNRGTEERLRQQLARLTQLEQARAPWAGLNQARGKVKDLETARNFPARGLERWEKVQAELQRLHRAGQSRREEAASLTEQLRHLKSDEALLGQRAAIEALSLEREKLADAAAQYPLQVSAREQAAGEFRRQLRALGPDWDAARLESVDTSVQVRQRVQDYERRLRAGEHRLEAAQAGRSAMQEAAAAAKRRAEEAARALNQAPPPPAEAAEFQSRREAVRLLRVRLHERELAAARLEGQQTAVAEAEQRLELLAAQQEERPMQLAPWLALLPLLLGLGAGLSLFARGAELAGGLACDAGIILAALLYWLHHRQRRRASRQQAIFTWETERLDGQRRGAGAEMSRLSAAIAGLEEEIARAANILGAAPPADLAHLEAMSAALETAVEAWRDWQAKEAARQQAEDQSQAAAARLAQADGEMDRAARELSLLKTEWSDWLAARGFTEAVRPEGLEAVLQAVENARAGGRTLADRRQLVSQTEGYLTGTRDRLRQVLAACGRSYQETEPGVADLDSLNQALAQALEVQERQRALQAQLTAVTADLANLTRHQREAGQERDELLTQAGAADEEDFWRLGAAHTEWRDWRRKLEDAEVALMAIAGSPAAQAAIEDELGRRDPLELEASRERLAAELANLEASLHADLKEVGGLNRRLEELAASEELGQVLLDQRTVQEQLAAATRRWAALILCRHLVDRARQVYERERQPLVIQEADRFLNTMAHGRYHLLAAAGETQVCLEEDQTLARKAEGCWSAGLADQVFLAVRLGLAREFGRHSEPLPVILDDVLVKFDPSRRKNTAGVLLDFAREQQVLLFTCHPEFVDLITAASREPDHRGVPLACYTITDGTIRPLPLPAPQ